MSPAPDSRRLFAGAVRRLFDSDEAAEDPRDVPPRLTPQALNPQAAPPQAASPSASTATRMSRSRDKILTNLEEMYREAFVRAKESGDVQQQLSLDFAYRREQLYFEILLDVRDALERRG